MVENTTCFKTKFNALLLNLAYWIAMKFIGKNDYAYRPEFAKEIYATKKWILKVQRKIKGINRVDYFSIHHREKTNSHGDEYSWYYEKYQINKTETGTKYTIYSYGNYPYVWE